MYLKADCVQSWFESLQKKEREFFMDKTFAFQKLTPIDNVDMTVYDKAMEYVFANEDIRNIAISGGYGAGKSSMLESYKKVHPDKKFLHISLAHFDAKNGQVPEDEKAIVSLLEGKIINQLIHQMDPKEIEQTNFRIKRDIDDKNVWKVTLLTVAFIAIVCFLSFKTTWERMVNGFSLKFLKWLFYFTTTKEIELVLGAVSLVILGIAIYEVVRLQKVRRFFKKANIQGNEIEIFQEEKDSFFDKYLNEVLYLFEHAQVDGIVFEDIDRYSKNLVFGKLREINFLLNTRGKKEKPVRFFYLLRDDIFTSKDRAKFFDFILPIVPVVNASNSYDKFLEYFEDSNLLELFDANFLQNLSLYIDDMRILKNICNEFVVYYERLKTSKAELNPNKMLAMIAYKNIFPGDFGKLQVGKGYVHTLFAQKEFFRQNAIRGVESETAKLQQENAEIEKDLCDDLDELNAIYFTIDGRILVDGREESGYKTRKEFVKAILKSKEVKRYSTGYSSGWNAISIDNEKRAMEQNEEYLERKQILEKRSESKTVKNNRKIKECESRIEKLRHAYLRDIIVADNEKEIFAVRYINDLGEEEGFEEVKRSPYFGLIKFLIRNGYVEESYPDYMTYFYANSISVDDKNFLKSVAEKEGKSYEYELKNPALVISRMRVVDFAEPEALNFALLKELLSDVKTYNAELQQFLYNVWNTEPVEFVSGFLRADLNRKKFVEELNKYWRGACHWIVSTDGFSMDDRRTYIADTLCVSGDETLAANNADREITDFIENDADFLSLPHLNEEKIENGLKKLDIKFKGLNLAHANERLAVFVYKNNMYQINKKMVQSFLKFFYDVTDEEDLLRRSLTLVLSKPEEPLCKYVKENINLYIEILLAEGGENGDTEETVVFVLNCNEVTDENKKAYLDSSPVVLRSLNLIADKGLWECALKNDKVEKTGENLCEYYFLSGNGMDAAFVKFANGFDKNFVFEPGDLDEQYGENATDKLFWDVVKCNELNNDVYEEMADAFGYVVTNYDLSKLRGEKIEILIRKSILCLNQDTLESMREHHPQKVSLFIVENIREYVGLLDDDALPLPEILQLLEENIHNPEIFDCLMQAENLKNESKKVLLAKQIELGMEKSVALSYLEKCNFSDFLALLRGKRPKIKVTEANEKLLKVLRKKQWISSYKEDELEPGYFLTFGKKIIFTSQVPEKRI